MIGKRKTNLGIVVFTMRRQGMALAEPYGTNTAHP
mgnify:CR=1 FL=1